MSEGAFYILSILRESQGKIIEQELRNRISEDINKNLGPYHSYSKSYRMTRFKMDLEDLIKKGFVKKTDGYLDLPSDVMRITNRFPKPVTPSNVSSRLHLDLRNGQALKLEVLRLVCRGFESYTLKEELRKSEWTEKAIEAVLKQLDSEGFTKYPELKFINEGIKTEVETFIKNYEREVRELSIQKKTEAEFLRVRFQPKRKTRKLEANLTGVTDMLLEFTGECRNKNIEIVNIGIGQIEVLFNQILYRFYYNEGILNDIPYFDVERAVFICNKTGSNFTQNYFQEWNVEKWGKCATYAFDKLEKFNFSKDILFEFFENFLHERHGLIFDISSDVYNEVKSKFSELSSEIQQQKEELAKKRIYDEGLIYTKPDFPWSLGNKINEIFSKATSIVRICNPYYDNSTFNLLTSIKRDLKILLLITKDKRLSGKVKDKNLTKSVIEKTLKNKRIEVKLIQNLHSRFIIIDDTYNIFLSPDLQTRSLMSKYEYGYWTNNEEIIKDCVSYFDMMWGEAVTFNILEEIEKYEK